MIVRWTVLWHFSISVRYAETMWCWWPLCFQLRPKRPNCLVRLLHCHLLVRYKRKPTLALMALLMLMLLLLTR